jgi:putative inorganic carbon (HCO3(-)) transporter
MTILIAYTLVIATTVVSLFRPWVGVVANYLVAIWVPMAIWPWVFGGSRIALYIALSTILGFILKTLSGAIDFSALRSKQNLFMTILWLCLIISYFFSPIEGPAGQYSFQDPLFLLGNISKVIFFYFVAILTIDNKRKCHFLIWAMLFSAIYLIYWGNMEYFQGRMRGLHWTLLGPGYGAGVVSVYFDENCFAMFFVMAIPYLYFMGRYYKNKALKLFLWLNIPFAWHCIFLTASRGGLLGLSTVTLYIIIRSKSKFLSLAIPALLLIAFVFQSGEVIKMRGKSALDVEEDSSAQSRFDSWETGAKMIIDHPVTGVGIGKFLAAYPYYTDTRPFVAHNTIIQFASESGIGAGLMYLFLCFGIFLAFFDHRKLEALNIDPFILAVRESLTGGLAGFFVCAIFLNLATFELFYYTLVLFAVQTRLVRDALKNINSSELPRSKLQGI